MTEAALGGASPVDVKHRKIARLVLGAAAVALAGCGPALTATSPAQPPAPASSTPTTTTAAASREDPQGLRAIAGEHHVTYSITLHPRQCHTADKNTLPDPKCTPGSIDPAVTQANIHATICKRGWTAKVRPPETQTEHAKFDVSYPAYGFPATDSPRSEEDHLVPLEVGGSNDITNLWPELGPVPNSKDSVEALLNSAVCAGTVPLAAAQRAIAANWHTAGKVLGIATRKEEPRP